MVNIKISENLKDLMAEKGLNQSALGKEIHISQTAISAWIRKTKEPCIESLWILADYFGCTIDQLVGRENLY